MQPPNQKAFTSEEIDFMKLGSLFEKKEALTKRLQSILEDLQKTLYSELRQEMFLAPPETDFTRGQVVRGERFHQRPYIYLDFPKYFSRQAMFTFRSFFWWGWDFAFAWILSGPFLNQYRERLLDSLTQVSSPGFYLSLAEDPWEWRKSSPYTVALSDMKASDLRSRLMDCPFLKIQFFVALDDPIWEAGTLAEEGVRVFNQLRFIVER